MNLLPVGRRRLDQLLELCRSEGSGLGGVLAAAPGGRLAPTPSGALTLTPAAHTSQLNGGVDAAASLVSGRLTHRPALGHKDAPRLLCLWRAEAFDPADLQAVAAHQRRLGVPLLAVWDKEAGPAPSYLAERLAFWVEVVESAGDEETDDAGPPSEYQTAPGCRSIDDDELLEACVRAAHIGGVASLRAPLLAVRAAAARARAAGRPLQTADALWAVRWVIGPRAAALPPRPDAEPAPSPAASRFEQVPGPQAETVRSAPPHPEGTAAARGGGQPAEGPLRRRPGVRPSPTGAEPTEEMGAAVPPSAAEPHIIERLDAWLAQGPQVKRPSETDPSRAAPGRRPIALIPTLLAALPFQSVRPRRPGRLSILPGDLRRKRLRDAGLDVLLIDASASMRRHRLDQVKGLADYILSAARRQKRPVAVIAAQGRRARVLCRPGRRHQAARLMVRALRAAGGTPLAGGLWTAAGLLRKAPGPARLILLSDGRGNDEPAPAPAGPRAAGGRLGERAAQAAVRLRRMPVRIAVVDTAPPWLRLGASDGRMLAECLNAAHLPLHRFSARRHGES